APGTVMTVREFLERVDKKVPGIENICKHRAEEREQRLQGLTEGLRKLGIAARVPSVDDEFD
ncbi:MAG: hypothetical protein ABIK89_09810, partial [Planctomycetota bacterium]